MDVLRGAAVLLVVVYHSVFLSETRGELAVPAWVDVVNTAVAPLRMPVLVLLSGLLLGPSLRKGWRRYFAGKLQNIGWPYLVWTLVMFALFWPGAPLLGYLRGGTYLWFLLFLLIYFVAAWLLRPVPVLLVIGLAFVGSLLAPGDSKYVERLLYLFALFMVGHLVARTPRLLTWVQGTRWSLGLGVLLVGAHVAVVGLGEGYSPVTVLGTVGGLLLMVPLARAVAGLPLAAPLRFAGVHSLVFYVVHYPLMIVVVTLATGAGIDSWLVTGVLALSVALVAGAALAKTRRLPVVGWLFTAPVLRRRPSAALTR